MPARPESFEYAMWLTLRNYHLPTAVQTRLGNDILRLTEKFFLASAPELEIPERSHAGFATHYFASASDGPTSRCGRAYRSRLPPDRITDEPAKTTCSHCRRCLVRDGVLTSVESDELLRAVGASLELDSAGNSGYTEEEGGEEHASSPSIPVRPAVHPGGAG